MDRYNIPLCNTADFFLMATTLLCSHQLILKEIVLTMPMSILLQYASLMQNMNKSTSMMLLFSNNTYHLISAKISSMYHPNIKSNLMASLESNLTRRFILTSSMKLSQYHHAYPVPHIQYPTQPHGQTWYT